jgi:ABC-type branched-subunit amino acid transport system ATPase component
MGTTHLLQVDRLNAGYGFLQILREISIHIEPGESVGLIGSNGAGKTTTLRAIAGLLKPTGGEVFFQGKSIAHRPPYQVSRMGMSYISEDLNLFTDMSVQENLLMGAYAVKDQAIQKRTLEFVYSLFPRLKERENQKAGTMSGGERKMLAIARGLMSNPQLILVDEPSLGLAPILVADVFESLHKLQQTGVTILLVEQRVEATLEITNRAYVMEQGRIVLEGPSRDLRNNEHVKSAYLGI